MSRQCSICGREGHNSRTCTKEKSVRKNENVDDILRDRSVHALIDQLTPAEQNKVRDKIIKIKQKYAPNARGTIIARIGNVILTVIKNRQIGNG